MKIRHFFLTLFICLFFSPLYPLPAACNETRGISINGELPFVFVICSYNNAKWVKKNLDSVFMQEYSNFRVIYVDDASEDGTAEAVEEYIKINNLHKKITLIKNTKRIRKVENIYNAYHSCRDNELIAQLDGDDWLAHAGVLTLLNKIFSDKKVWVSYGQFMHSTGKLGFCCEIPLFKKEQGLFRQEPFVTTHLKVFYAWLFKMVKLQDLIAASVPEWSGNYYPAANDCATIYPMLEMARERVRFNSEVIYVFNRDNPTSTHYSALALQQACAREIKALPVYPRLKQSMRNRLKPFRNATADCLIVSDNPLLLRPVLKSLKHFLYEVGTLLVWYESQDDNTHRAFQELSQEFGDVSFYNVASCTAQAFLASITQGPSGHVLCMQGNILLNASVHCKKWILELERTFAHVCYGTLTRAHFEEHNIPYQHVRSALHAWKFVCDKQGLINPHNFGLSLYRKKDIIAAFKGKKTVTLQDIIHIWSSTKVSGEKIGLFFD